MAVVADRLGSVGLVLAAAATAIAMGGLPLRVAIKRLLPLNGLMLLLVVVLPLSTPGTAVWQLGPLEFSHEGLRLAAMIALKGNAVVLTLIGAVGHDGPHHARTRPEPSARARKLTHLLLFTVRYLDVLHREYLRLRAAMKARGFRPRMDRHTYRSLGYLVGMLLVAESRSRGADLGRHEVPRVPGPFLSPDHFAFSRRDVPFCPQPYVFLILWLMEWRVFY